MLKIGNKVLLSLIILISTGICQAQFLDSFNSNKIEGWSFFAGDGDATMDFVQLNGYARIIVDATKDKHNVWWTVIKRDVTDYLDLEKLKDPSYELRVEAKIRVSAAPRRVNFMVNTQRTINYHIDLREFDIPDTSDWHIISMTTTDFDAVPGDRVYVQFCVTDFGPGEYYADLDYYRADIVNVNLAGPDMGEPLPYHPPLPDISTFSNHLTVTHDGLINADFPDVNFSNWQTKENGGDARILTVNANQWAILRWDFNSNTKLKADGPGVLELTTQAVAKGGNYVDTYGEDLGVEFGKVRVIEIIGGDNDWDQNLVTYNNFIRDSSYSDVFNTQMIFDVEPLEEPGGKSYITLSRPVLQRLLDGTTKGLLIRPLGSIDASFYDSENPAANNGPKLHFNVIE
jgi:hypothetical protein